jgi:hypothetical protein
MKPFVPCNIWVGVSVVCVECVHINIILGKGNVHMCRAEPSCGRVGRPPQLPTCLPHNPLSLGWTSPLYFYIVVRWPPWMEDENK